jgi:phage terminase Nu1 subunit (DNA packaging protein)
MSSERYVTRDEIAFLLGVEARSITNYVRKHPDFPSRVKGRDRDFPVQRCLQWKRDKDVAEAIASLAPPAPSTKQEAEERIAVANAELAEIKVAKARSEVIVVAQAVKVQHDTYTRMRASALGKPGEYAPRILHLKAVSEAMPILRQLIDDIFTEWQDVAGSGIELPDDDDADDEGDA